MAIKRTISPREGFLKEETTSGTDTISIQNLEVNTFQADTFSFDSLQTLQLDTLQVNTFAIDSLEASSIEASLIQAPTTLTGTYTISSPTTITLDPTSEIINDAPMKLVSKTVSELSSLTASAGSVVYCTNESGGAIPVFFDGSNWRRFSDRNIVS